MAARLVSSLSDPGALCDSRFESRQIARCSAQVRKKYRKPPGTFEYFSTAVLVGVVHLVYRSKSFLAAWQFLPSWRTETPLF
jgi:hypothetical protein